MEKFIKYSNGLRLIVDNIPTLRSISCGIWVGTGSSNETLSNNGISHFTEHQMFKGTDKMSAFEIANAFEYLGASVNAFTSKECTCYYYKSIDENAEKCFELLSHIFFNSTFPSEELDKERRVILEEINMVEDSSEDICYDLLAKSLYKDEPLGLTILGSSDNVKRFTKDDIDGYMSEKYCADNIVVSIAGNISLKTADAYVQKYVLPFVCVKKSTNNYAKRANQSSTHTERIKDFEQSNIAVSFPSVKINDKLSTTQATFSTILGGAMSSRLFQRVREQMGLAYSIYSAPSAFKDNGSLNILLNINVKNTSRVLEAVFGELKSFKNGITDTELHRAKTQLKSSCIFSQENVQSVMLANGKLLTVADELYDIDKKIKEIDSVSKDGIIDFANSLFHNGVVCTAYVGKEHNVDIQGIFRF